MMKDFVCKEQYDLSDFIALIALLRSENGCPWDRVQTHESIRRNLLEECYELCETLDLNDSACKKLVSRHPNLFGGETGMDWDQLKRAERGEETVADSMRSVSAYLPALWRAEKIQKKMAKTGFDWPDVESALRKVEEETQELREGIANNDRENMIEEVGDLLLTVVDVARICGIDPEMALHRTCEKGIRRFDFMEKAAAKQGKQLEELPLSEMEELLQQARQTLEGKEPDRTMQAYFRSLEQQ